MLELVERHLRAAEGPDLEVEEREAAVLNRPLAIAGPLVDHASQDRGVIGVVPEGLPLGAARELGRIDQVEDGQVLIEQRAALGALAEALIVDEGVPLAVIDDVLRQQPLEDQVLELGERLEGRAGLIVEGVGARGDHLGRLEGLFVI